jgi:hypothetical protein
VINGGFEFGSLEPVWTSDGGGVSGVTSGDSADGDNSAFVALLFEESVTLTQQVVFIRGGSTVFCSAFGRTLLPGFSGSFSINIDGVPCASATLDTNGQFERFSGSLVVENDVHIITVVLNAQDIQQLSVDAISIVPIAGDQYNQECAPTGLVPQNCDYRGFSDNFCSCKS